VSGRALNRALARFHYQNPIDIVQYCHLGGSSLFKKVNVPSVVRLSSYTPLARARGGYEFAQPFQTRQQEFIERLALKKADAIYGPSRIIGRVVEEEIGREVGIIESPFILDTTDLDLSLFSATIEGSEYLLFFGSLSVLKGLVTIADILYTLLSRYPKLKFVLVGKQIADYQRAPMMDYVWDRAKEHRDRVIYLGQLHHEQLYPIIANAKAVVLPSRIDNFPNTCLEAMALSQIVIGTHGTSFEQLLVDGVSGFLCDIDDPKSLLASIEKALGLTDETRARMGKMAAARIYDLRPERVVKQLLDFYYEVIKRDVR
jgi:glycogen synthase